MPCIQGNHVDTVGCWVKQTAAYFKSVTRENTIRNNVFHDSPRSLVNWNDGMAVSHGDASSAAGTVS